MILVVDGSNLVMRAIHAMQRTHLSSDDIPTGPLMTFINMLSRYVRETDPDRVVVCWDGGVHYARRAIYADYKANRNAVPYEFEEYKKGTFALVRQYLTLAGVHHVRVDDVEADDLVALYTMHRQDEKVIILSGDKDFLQLLGDDVEQIRPGSNLSERWTASRVEQEMGCHPDHLAEVMALTGDTTDNIPGIPGFGLKTACKLLAAYDWDLNAAIRGSEAQEGRVTFERRLCGHEEEVRRNWALVDLTTIYGDIDMPPAPPFRPTTIISALWSELLDFLNLYRLASIKDRYQLGEMWPETVTAGETHG
jgi:DNA polymerase-1